MHVDSPVPEKSTHLSTLSRVPLPENIVQKLGNELRAVTRGEHDRVDFLRHIWFAVHRVLSKVQTQRAPLADENEFLKNLKIIGEEPFINLFNDIVKRASWRELLENDVFLKQQELKWDIPLALTNASVGAWGTTFKGQAANVLIDTIANYLDKRRNAYAMQTSFINSSGTGKSRIVHEVAAKIITVPMCLRLEGTQGFPPPDVNLRNWFNKLKLHNQGKTRMELQNFISVLLITLLEHLQEIESKEHHNIQSGKSRIPELPPYDPEKRALYEDLVKERQVSLASKFCELMNSDISFESHNDYRLRFYEEVINSLGELSRAPQGSNSQSSPRYVYELENDVRKAGESLCRFIDPLGVLDSDKGSRWPLVILAFDESHILTEFPERCSWTLFSELRRTLRVLHKQAIFSLFLATAGTFHRLSPEIKSDPSSRVTNEDLRPLNPITEISFDDLAHPAMADTLSLSQVVTTDWMSHLGRPLFGVYHDQLQDEGALFELVKHKLLDGRLKLEEGDSPGSLACLSVRFSLEFNADSISRGVACRQIECHMRLCLAATTGFDRLITLSGSEPLLAEAAFHLMHDSRASMVRHLADHSDLHCVDRGRRGELVAALIIMQARDAAVAAQPPGHRERWISVNDFMQALLPRDRYLDLKGSLPSFWRSGENMTFSDTFKDYALWFNHVIRIEDSKMINVDYLWTFITRGAMILCTHNQYGVDIVLPLCHQKENLSPRTVSAILIQVKNDDKYGCSIVKTLFDGMAPMAAGLFENHLLLKPVIRMVFALASKEHGILFPELRKRDPGRYIEHFTAFDIWCAGLLSFKDIENDLASYQVLLDRSLQPHDAFKVEELNDPYLDPATKASRGRRRRRMAALTMSSPDHRQIHLSAEVARGITQG